MNDKPPKTLLRRTAGCLIKAPLGCLAFLFGGVVVGVLFLPPVLGGLVTRALDEWSDEELAGSIEVRDAWFGSFYDEQELEGIVLRDPEGLEILRANLRAPSFAQLLGDEVSSFGPVEIHVESMRLHQDAEGRTNLERALARKRGGDWGIDLQLSSGDDGGTSRFLIRADLIEWRDYAGRSLTLLDATVDASLEVRRRRLALDATGRGAIAGEPDSYVSFTTSCGDIGRDHRYSTWSFELESGPAPLSLPLAILGSTAPLEPLFGERLGSMSLKLWPASDMDRERGAGRGDRRIELELRSMETSARVTGLWPEGTDALVGQDEDVCQVEFAPGSGWAEEVLYEVLPLSEDLELPGEGRTTLLLSEFTLPFDAALEKLRGEGIFVVDRLSYAIDGSLREALRSYGRERIPNPSLEVRFDRGRVVYERFGMPAGGVLLRLDGDYDLLHGDYRLKVKPPGCEAIHIRGKRGKLELE